ncbi:ANTAR domain-containing protein [Streptomyces collinus]|uniref:ANTAR domain-containing protein n=1 Tax=Streptomyces collinus TaxID=42684 RepID=UPI0036628D93
MSVLMSSAGEDHMPWRGGRGQASIEILSPTELVMTTSRTPQPLPEIKGEASPTHLQQENDQLRHAVASHATVDQAIGVLIAVHRIAPAAGFEVLREVSQQTNIKLHSVAQTVIGWALGEPLPRRVGRELDAAVQRRSHRGDGSGQAG